MYSVLVLKVRYLEFSHVYVLVILSQWSKLRMPGNFSSEHEKCKTTDQVQQASVEVDLCLDMWRVRDTLSLPKEVAGVKSAQQECFL